MWYYKILRVKCFNLFFVSLLWIIYEGNFTLMLTPLVVIRKTCRPTKYFPPPVKTDLAQWEQSMERRLRITENWRDSHSHYYNWTDWEMVKRMWDVRNLISQLQPTGQLSLIDQVINSTEEPSDFSPSLLCPTLFIIVLG